MKKILLSLALFTTTSFGNEAPSYMKDGTITVTLADGKQYAYSANDFKVVPRVQEEQAEKKEKAPGGRKVIASGGKNRITVHGGGGFVGLKTTTSGSQTEITQRKGAVGGVSLSRLINDSCSVSGTALSNKTFLFGVGLDF